MTWAYGKAIILGEHAVVYGHPALAGAIDCGIECTIVARASGDARQSGDTRASGDTRQSGPLRLRVPDWNVDITSADEHPLAAAMRALVARMAAGDLDGDIEVTTRLPAAAGLGSSAALSVALVRAMAQVLGRTLDNAEVEAIADSAERCFHKNPSGVDVALAARGGMGLYVRDQGFQPIFAAPLVLAVGLSAQARSTAAMVEKVAALRRANPGIADHRLAALGDAARAGADAVMAGNLARLGQLMSRAHQTLAALGVSTPFLDELVVHALDTGALGAKLTGAGGGGAVIALCGNADQAGDVVKAWHERGYKGFVCRAGVTQ